jgi:hypothetical protein
LTLKSVGWLAFMAIKMMVSRNGVNKPEDGGSTN